MGWKQKLKDFHEWQQRPYEVDALAEEEHVCSTCQTHYVGNFCPRCGQSSSIGRYSFKTAIFNFLDVWGMGNRSMFRTLRDLILRPGYMIRDYLQGMQMAYFPPFQMLFLLTTLSFLVIYGGNIKGITFDEMRQEALVLVEKGEKGENKNIQSGAEAFNWMMDIQEQCPNLVSLASIVILSFFLYPFFRRSKTIPDLRYSEFLVASIYIANMTTLYETVMMFFCLPMIWVSLVPMASAIIPLKQLSGFSWWRTILYSVLGIISMYAVICIGAIIFALCKLAIGGES